MRRLAILLALAACAEKKEEQGAAAPAPVPVAPATPPGPVETRLPPLQGNAIGDEAPVALIDAADDGAWTVFCRHPQTANAELRVVAGAGPGVIGTTLLATGPRDVIYRRGETVYRLDVIDRVERALTPGVSAALDPATRRVVVGREGALVVHDVGREPRTLPFVGTPGPIVLRRGRWAEVGANAAAEGACYDARHAAIYTSTVVDLDPVEAVDAVGPQIAVTAAGEITIGGVVAVPADCGGQVLAAISEPPRMLVHCASSGYYHAGPGRFQQLAYAHGHDGIAGVADHLIVDRRVVCVWGGCVDLVDGGWVETYDPKLVWGGERHIVLVGTAAIHVHDVETNRTEKVPLPRIGREVKIDLVTGKRTTGAEPATPAYVDAAGSYLLFGRYFVDLGKPAIVATLGSDALAIDAAGRVLVPAWPGQGPLRWVDPSAPE